MKYFMCVIAVICTFESMLPGGELVGQIRCRCCALLAGVCFILAAVLEISE